MPTWEQFAASVPVPVDLSRRMDESGLVLRQAMADWFKRQRLMEALQSPYLQSLMQQAAAPTQIPSRPGLFAPNVEEFAQGVPAMGEALGLRRGAQPAPAGGEKGLAARAQPPTEPPPEPGRIVLPPIDVVLPPEEKPPTAAETAISAPKVAGLAGLAGMAQAGPAAPSVPFGVRTPEEWDIFSSLLPSVERRSAGEERLQGVMVNAEQRDAANRMTNMVRGLSIVQQDLSSLRRMEAEWARLAAKAKTKEGLRDMQRLAQMRITLANAAVQRFLGLVQGGYGSADPNSPEGQAFERAKVEMAELMENARRDSDSLGMQTGGSPTAIPPAPAGPNPARVTPLPLAKLDPGITPEFLMATGKFKTLEEAQAYIAKHR